MNKKLNTKLIYNTPLYICSSATRMSHDNHDKSDTKEIIEYEMDTDDGYFEYKTIKTGDKDKALIKRVGVQMHHESVLEMLDYVFDVEMSTKTLLAFSRHRIGVSLTMRSTRYTTKKNVDFHKVQGTKSTKKYLNKIMDIVNDAIKEGLSNDEVSLLLPQAYVYRGQIKFNGRSLRHFLKLRLAKGAHFQIRELAEDLYNNLPEDHKYLYEDLVNKKGE